MPLCFSADSGPEPLQYGYDSQFVDEIDELGSSDPSVYGMSSPSPNQSRGFVVPAALQGPATRLGYGLSAPRQGNTTTHSVTESSGCKIFVPMMLTALPCTRSSRIYAAR